MVNGVCPWGAEFYLPEKLNSASLKKIQFLTFLILLIAGGIRAQDLVGKISDNDTLRTPLFLAEITQLQGEQVVATCKTYFDGTFRIKVKPSQSYKVKVSYPGRTDTTVSIVVDKRGTLTSGSLFISLRKDGLRLMGFILDKEQDIPLKEVSITLKNVMTRREEKYFTDINGYYNLKMDYETNYTLKIDKLSPGIMNKYQDTSFNISTIGFNKPVDFKLDIKLGPTNGYIAPRPDYDPRAKARNRNLKPILQVLGTRDSVKRREQDSIVNVLALKMNVKDSVIASLDKRISQINKEKENAKVALRTDESPKKETKPIKPEITAADQKKKDEDEKMMQMETARRKQQLEKSEADLKVKQAAEKEAQAKIDKQNQEAEAKLKEQEAQAKARADKEEQEKATAEKERLAREAKRQEEQAARDIKERDEMIKAAKALEASRELAESRRKKTVDSLARINKEQAKAKSEQLEKERQQKEQAENAEIQRKLKEAKDRKQAEQEQQAKLEKEEQSKKLAELAALKKAREEKEQAESLRASIEAKKKKEDAQRELEAMKKAREEAEAKLLAEKRDAEAKERMSKKEAKRVAKELEDQAMHQKEAQEVARRSAEQQKRIAARQAAAEAEQRELEAKKALEEQEKNRLAEQMQKVRKDEQVRVLRDQDAKQQDANPDQALKDNTEKNTIAYWENKIRQEKRSKDEIPYDPNVYDLSMGATMATKLIHSKGFVKNGQTEDPIPNVSINIRRLNSVVSQEVSSDEAGRYDMVVDSGYFYLVSFYKDKYEISKQILDLTGYKKAEYTMAVQFLKELDDFDPTAKMPVISFQRNSSKLPNDIWSDLEAIVKMMKDIPQLKIKLYGLASLNEDYPMELSVTRARLVADLILESGIKPARVRINGIGAYRPRSGCTDGKACTEENYKQDRVVMYRVVKE